MSPESGKIISAIGDHFKEHLIKSRQRSLFERVSGAAERNDLGAIKNLTGQIEGLDKAEEALQTAFDGVSGILASFGFDKIDIPEVGKTAVEPKTPVPIKKEPLERKKERALEIQAASCLHREGALSRIEGLLAGETIENYAGRFSLAQPEEKYLDLLNASWEAVADKRNHSPIAKDEKKLFGDVVGRILKGEKVSVNKNDPDQVNFTLLVSLINYFRQSNLKRLDDLRQILFPCLSIRVDLASCLVVGMEKS